MSNVQYVVPFDTLDVNLLSQYILKPAQEKKLLWSARDLDGEKSYCQVGIISEECDNYYEPYPTYTCHVCNINVPQIYFKEHTQSKKHETYKQITEHVLKGMSKFVNTSLFNTKNCSPENLYYCAACAKAVLLENKQKHHSSSDHLKCVEDENVVRNFLNIYTGKEDKEKDVEHSNHDENEHEKDGFTRDYEEKLFKTSNGDSSDRIKDLFAAFDCSSASNTGPNYNGSRNIYDVERHVVHTGSLNIFNASENLYEYPNIFEDFDEYTLCNVCGVYIEPLSYLQHMKSMEHALMLRSKERNKEYLSSDSRTTVQFEALNRVTHNGMARGFDSVAHSAVQNTPFTAFLENLRSMNMFQNEGRLFDNIDVPSSSGLNSVFFNTFAQDPIDPDKLIDYAKQLVPINGLLAECTACKVKIPYIDRNIIEHVEGRTHTLALIALFRENRIKKLTTGLYYCDFCQVNLDNFREHIELNVGHVKMRLLHQEMDQEEFKRQIYKQTPDGIVKRAYGLIYKDLLNKHRIRKMTATYSLCEMCDKMMHQVEEIDHIFSDLHKFNLHNT